MKGTQKIISRHYKAQVLYKGIKRIQDKMATEIKDKYSKRLKDEFTSLFQKEKPNDKDLKFLSKFLIKIDSPNIHGIIADITQEAIRKELWRANSYQDTKIVMYLSKNGELYREPKEDHCYKIEKGSIRHQIVSILMNKDDFYPTKELEKYTDSKNTRSIRDSVSNINKNAINFSLTPNIKSKHLIVSEENRGYKINDLYLKM